MKNTSITCWRKFAILLAVPLAALADTGTELFESKVRPVLVERCYECHSAEKTKGGLALDTKAGWEKGGDSGPAIVPGKPDESLLIKAVRYHDEDLAMPPQKKGGKLPDSAIAALTEWVRLGAPDPRLAVAKLGGMKADEAKSWWAFQPLPKADNTRNIDGFIDAKLAGASLQLARPTDPRTLIRRATYDLTGMPPTPEEVEAFIADPSPNAYAQLIDRLLNSPQYGVQWGRRWLDVVRYADSAGENTDRPLPHAWRYRNWVIDAFNRDTPYDEFVRLQLAGDILNASKPDRERSEGIIATGYLAIARRFGHDIDKDMYLTYEDVIDNVGKNFLALTTGCARCHDHKYDPITAQDYYALYGIFESTQFAFPGCEPKGKPRDLVPLMSQNEVEALMKPWRERTAKAETDKKHRAGMAGAVQKATRGATAASNQVLASAKVAEGQSVSLGHKKIAVRKGEVIQLTVSPGANHGADSTLIEWNILETGGAERTWNLSDLVQSLTKGNPQPSRGGAEWCFIEVTPKGPVFLSDKAESINGNGALKKWSNGDTPSVFVNSADQQVMVWTTLQAESFFIHPGQNRPVAVAWVSPLNGEVTVTGRVADAHPAKTDGVSFELQHIAAPDFGPALVSVGRTVREKVVEVEPAPMIPVAYAVVDAKPKNTRFQLRGDPEKLGEEVPRRWLSVLGGDAVPKDAGSGRKQLGEWIAKSPITARVMVNRIWLWHFGGGLVRSPDDFGSRGEKPTHPELLDWLASQFAASGYSVKAMHRLIMSSDAYQRASAESHTADPDNLLLAHFMRRRLTAEEMRDSLLTASAQLDLTPGEAHPFPAESTWKFTQHSPFSAVYETNKRSVYRMVQRQRRDPFLSLFDGADPNASTASRQTTTVPTQALYFINDPFFHAQAAAAAASWMKLASNEARLAHAYRILLQRRPSAAETQRATHFLSSYPASDAEKWAAYARVLMASNEFLHID